MHSCPICDTKDYLELTKTYNGWRHVECFKCNYMGPGEGTMKLAIDGHNAFAAAIKQKQTEAI